MTGDERHVLVRRKIERADKHINDLEAELCRFFDSKPYKVATKRDPQTRRLIYYLDSVAGIPFSFGAITGDILNNLRSSLDHLAQQLYLVGTGKSEFRDQTSFPISRSAKDFKSGIANKVEGMRKDAIDAICALEPYKGGNGADLWTLHRLNNVDKHRLIVTVGANYSSVDIGPHIASMMQATRPEGWTGDFPVFEIPLRPADNLFPLKAGDPLFLDAPDAEQNDKIKFRFEVVLHEPGIIEGKPILETMIQFRNRISSTVDAFKPFLT